MREAEFDRDGWSLDDGEERHAKSPDRFEIPERWIREVLEPGDFAQLIFRIAVDDDDYPEAFERMWVVVTARTPGGGYLGVLDNEPSCIAENDTFWRGSELPFSPRHIIDVREGNEESGAIAVRPPEGCLGQILATPSARGERSSPSRFAGQRGCRLSPS